jgi:adenylate cyclase
VVSYHGGTVIKTIGDEVMCTFPETPAAIAAAKGMNEALERKPPDTEGPSRLPNLHVGVHRGTVIIKEDDVFGDAVNVAARLVKLAKQRQILASKDVIQELAALEKASVRFLGRMPVRGKKEEIPIYEFVWEECDMTIIADHALISPAMPSSMELIYEQKTIRLGPSKPSVKIGRDLNNDIVLKGNQISRSHARVEIRSGKFFLSDRSSNGTYVFFQNGEMIYLRGDQVVLYGSGSISPGSKPEPGAAGTISFHEVT